MEGCNFATSKKSYHNEKIYINIDFLVADVATLLTITSDVGQWT